MVNQEMVKKWNLKEFGFESKDGVVIKMFCKVCKGYYNGNPYARNKLQGHIKKMVKNWVDGTSVIKKNNSVDHLKSNSHNVAVISLKHCVNTSSEASAIACQSLSQRMIADYSRKATKDELSQL